MRQRSGSVHRARTAWIALAAIGAIALAGCSQGAAGDLTRIADARGLTVEQAEAALKVYTPPGEHDPYVLFSSGGHSGNIHLIGVPSMRLLKTVPVFTPESWSGYGQGSDLSETVLDEGSSDKQAARLEWGDTHHPAISETEGEYDGRFAYIQDRANGRLGFVDLRDFKAKQIVDIPNIQSSHGGAFVTPNTEYVHVSSKTPMSQDGYADIDPDSYAEHYRGQSTFLAVDQETGRIDIERSFQVELPPYNQDLADSGKLGSHGLVFIGSYNSEMATGGNTEGGEPIEVGASQNDFDFLHVIDWQKAEEVLAAGGFEERNGIRVIPIDTAAAEGILYLIREPRSPHGIDVDPTGHYAVVGGKLDPNVTIFDTDEIRTAMAENDIEGTDPFGVPILSFDATVAGQVEVGLGPLHTQFDDKGHGFTSLFLDSAVAKFTLGEKAGVKAEDAFKLVDKVSVNYNVGHLATTEGDTVAADGQYLVALNKWSIDRFPVLGTLKPQNFQLIDLSGEKMEILADMPIGFGEPHYVQIIKTERLSHAIEVYDVGTEPLTMQPSRVATLSGEERVDTSTAGEVHVYMTAIRSHFTPDVVRVKEGDRVFFHVTNVETTPDATHGFAIPGYNVQASLDPGEVVTIELDAVMPGSFAMYCTEFCSALHLEMQGWLMVEPASETEPAAAESPAAEPAAGESPAAEPEVSAAPEVDESVAPEASAAAPPTVAIPTLSPDVAPVVVPDGGTIEVIGNQFKFDPPAISISSAGSATVSLVNTDVVEHDWTIDELQVSIKAPVGGSGEATLSGIAPGTYPVYCTIPGHAAAGMVGTLVVTE